MRHQPGQGRYGGRGVHTNGGVCTTRRQGSQTRGGRAAVLGAAAGGRNPDPRAVTQGAAGRGEEGAAETLQGSLRTLGGAGT